MKTFRAAAGAVDLRPIVGAPLTGFGSRLEPSLGVHDPLMGKVLLLDDGSTRLAWGNLDLIGLSPEDDARLRQMIAGRLGIPPRNVLVSCTHTHSGPGSMQFRGPLGAVDAAWLESVLGAIVDAAAGLPSRLRPARMGCATTVVPGLGYNRQDGASPIDERLLVVHFRDDDDRAIAAILNYATHPVVLGENNLYFTADYPGYATRGIEKSFGGVTMFVLGAAGDVDPVIYRDLGRKMGTFEIAEKMGQTLADAAAGAIGDAEVGSDISLRISETQIELPLDPPPASDQVQMYKQHLLSRRGPLDSPPTSDEAKYAMFELAWIDDLERAVALDAVPHVIRAQVTAVRIGSLSVVAFPFEIYSQIGLAVRQHLEHTSVIIAGYTNGLLGYAPTDRAIEEGGYGPALAYRFFPHLLTPIARGAESRLVQTATDLLDQLK
jgi:hypothetical protein